MSRILNTTFLTALLSISASAFAATQPALMTVDKASAQNAIRAMSGCYAVTFQFIETFVKDPKYPIRSAQYSEYGTEWVDLDVDTEEQIALQHVLVIPDGAMKHWRQEWTYEPTQALEFQGNNTWATRKLAAGSTVGQWKQSVGQVDDSPRYSCVAPWVQWQSGEKSQNYWECQTYAPLPRREFTKRSDYNVLDRRNRHMLTAEGWVQEEDNRKLLVNEKGVTEIAQERGLDTYRKIDDSKCDVARNEWNKTKGVWHVIQGVWAHMEGHHAIMTFKSTVDGQVMWAKLFALADSYQVQIENTGIFNAKALEKETHDIIHQYLITE